jgi:hypothetical protein
MEAFDVTSMAGYGLIVAGLIGLLLQHGGTVWQTVRRSLPFFRASSAQALPPAIAGIHAEIVAALDQQDYSEVEDLLKLCHDYGESHRNTIRIDSV